MEVITMKLADLIKPEKNVRIHTEQQLKEFRRSVKMFGQIRPIVVDENNVILAGNGLYDTLIAMGKETADVYRYNNLTIYKLLYTNAVKWQRFYFILSR